MNFLWTPFVKHPGTLVALLLAWAWNSVGQTPLIGITNHTWKYFAVAGGDPGADWQQPEFDDGSWPTGRGLFGVDVGYPYPFNTPFLRPTEGGPPVAFFRTTFNWFVSSEGQRLIVTNYFDDGVVLYLNGVEITRYNMPSGVADQNTLALNALNEPVMRVHVIDLNANTNFFINPLRSGANVLAASVHNNNGSFGSDTVFGLSVYGQTCFPSCFLATQPTNRVIFEGRSTTFVAIEQCAVPAPSFQWYRDIGAGEELIPGATSDSYTLTNAAWFDSGVYYAKATSWCGVVASRQAQLRVDHVDTYPDLVSARLGANALEIQATVTELLCTNSEACAGSALDTFSWEIVNADNPTDYLNPVSITMDGLVLRFTLDPATPWRVNTRYIVRPFSLGGSTSIANLRGALMLSTASAIVSPLFGPSLFIAPTNDGVVVSWNADPSWRLVGSTNIAGPYEPVPGAGAGSVIHSSANPAAQFYKLNYVPQP